MLNALRNDSSFERALAHRNKLGKRTRRKRERQVESLESRTLLSYTFSYDSGTETATATGSAAVDSLVLEPSGGLLYYSENSGAFTDNWGGNTVPIASDLTVDVSVSTGDGSSLQLGTTAGPASTFGGATLITSIPTLNTTDAMVIDDSAGTTLAGSGDPYSINSGVAPYAVTGPGFVYNEPIGIFNGGITLEGSAVDGDIYNVLSSYPDEPVNLTLGGTGYTDAVNIGSTGGAGTMTGLTSPTGITDPLGFYTLNFHDENDTTAQTWTLDDDDLANTASVSFASSIATTSYRPGDLTSPLTINGGTGGNTFLVNDTTSDLGGNFTDVDTDINDGIGNNTVDVFATGTNTLNIVGQGGFDTVTLGGVGSVGMQNLAGTINVSNPTAFTALTLDDSEDLTGQDATITDNGTSGSVTGLSPATINYTDANISTMTINGGSGGNSFSFFGTVPTLTTLNTGTGDNTVDVYASAAGSLLEIDGEGGFDTVDIGMGTLSGIAGAIIVDNTGPGLDTLTVDGSSDPDDHAFDLVSPGTSGTLTDDDGNMPGSITYTTAVVDTFTLDAGPAGDQLLIVDFSNGNPIPTFGAPGLIFNAGGNATSALNSHTMELIGELPSGAFASEIHNANDQTVFPQVDQYGSIDLTDSQGVATSLDYTGLQPITDTTSATDYTFNDFGYPDQSFSATNGPTILGITTLQFTNTPTPPSPTNFETTTIANKTNVAFNSPAQPGTSGVGLIGTVNVPALPTGLTSLTFNTNTNGNNIVSFIATPGGLAPPPGTTLFGGVENDQTNVTGTGIVGSPTVTALYLNGGPGTNTLNYNSDGEIPTVTPDGSGGTFITIPGFGRVDAVNYAVINIIPPPPVITPGPPVTINSVEGFQLVNTIVGTFTLPISPIPPSAPPFGFPASDFTATINWGDGSSSAGTIVQDASDPSIYYIEGTHTFAEDNTYTVTNTVDFTGGTITTTVGGVPVTVTYAPSGPTTLAPPSMAIVTQGTLAVTAFPIVGTEGLPIAAAAIATFIDAGGAEPVADYSATIDIVDSAGTTVVSVPAASITQQGSSAEYTVHAPAITLPEEGTYSVRVIVTDTPPAPGAPVTAAGWSTAVIADAPLTAGAAVPLTPHTGVALAASTVVGTFTDGDPISTVADFTAVVDWGDGSPTSLGTITQPGGVGTVFDVEGGHIYAKPGTYPITINVTDAGGSTVTLTGTATVTDLAVTGTVVSAPTNVPVIPITPVEDQSTGTIVLATYTDPNTLATVANESATVTWGDGTGTFPAAVTEIGGTAAGILFEVTGSHTYAEETPTGTPDTLTVTITTLGGVVTPLTTGPVTVLDAPLSSSNGSTITGVEGHATGTVLLGTFTDANQAATVADYTAGGGSVVVNWGDASAPQTLTAANLTSLGTPNGVIWEVSAAHTYAEEGSYAITVTVKDDGGSATVFGDFAAIADAPLTAPAQTPISTTQAPIYPIPEFAPPVFSGLVATFVDTNPTAPLSDFTTIIDWGDGTSPTAGTVTQPGGVGTAFDVSGSHTYAATGVAGNNTGHYTIQVFVTDVGGSKLTVVNTANVAATPITLTGILNPASDSGLSNGVTNVTNVTQPNFYGTASLPYSHVSLFATAVSTGVVTPIGEVQAGGDGSWSLTSGVVLPDGYYNITATAVDQFGETTTAAPFTVTSNLLIDTVGPVITGMFFNRLNGEVDFTIQDPAPGSGVEISSLLNSANYELTKVHANKAYPGKWIVTNITETPGAAAGSYDVAVTFNSGHTIRGGFYLFTIRDSSNGNSSVQDEAENHLDGVFYGSFPSGNGVNGSDFVAELSGYHNKIFAPQTEVGTSNNANGGVGGAPVGAVHSGNFSPIVPIGGGSVFGNDPKHLKGTRTKKAEKSTNHKLVKTKAHVVVKTVAHQVVKKTSVHDAALKALVEGTHSTRHKG